MPSHPSHAMSGFNPAGMPAPLAMAHYGSQPIPIRQGAMPTPYHLGNIPADFGIYQPMGPMTPPHDPMGHAQSHLMPGGFPQQALSNDYSSQHSLHDHQQQYKPHLNMHMHMQQQQHGQHPQQIHHSNQYGVSARGGRHLREQDSHAGASTVDGSAFNSLAQSFDSSLRLDADSDS